MPYAFCPMPLIIKMNLIHSFLGTCMIFGLGAAPACSEKKVQPQVTQNSEMPLPATEMPKPPPSQSETASIQPIKADSLRIIAPNSVQGNQFKALVQRGIDTNLHQKSLGEIMQTVGQWFLGKPYVGGLLDKSETEALVIDFEQFDCVLFVETVNALSKVIAKQEYDYDKFQFYLNNLRYRNGTLNGYGSRLHYFTDWAHDNSARGNVNDLTAAFGGVRLNKVINFMGTHRNSYAQLKNNDTLFNEILEMERSLRNRNLYYIPKAQIRSIYNNLRAGDIITTTTNIEGLDVTHTGLVLVTENGQKSFMHASSAGKQVMVSPDLHDYVNGRTQDPRGKF
jgi:Protein of unknown function (DUF1460)